MRRNHSLRTLVILFNHSQPSIGRDSMSQSLYYCLFAPHVYIAILRAHPVRGESHIQRNATGEVATTSPPFNNEPHCLDVLFVKAAPGTTFHILVTAPFCCDRKIPNGMCAKLSTVATSNNRDHAPQLLFAYASNFVQSFTAWNRQRFRAAITLLLLVHATYIYCYSARTSRSWWITHSKQRHQRGCNSIRLLTFALSCSFGLHLD